MKKILLYAFVLFSVTVSSCSSDDDDKKEPSQTLSINDTEVSLENANVYLVSDGSYGDGIYRKYIITDGEYVDGYGYSFNNYDEATYFLIIELAQMQGETFSTGKFPVWYNWESDTDPESNYSNIYFSAITSGQEVIYFNQDSVGDHEPINLSEGTEPGETIHFKYSGKLTSNDDEGDGFPGVFYFTGNVIDARPGH